MPDSIDASINNGYVVVGQVIPAGEEVLMISSNSEYSAETIYEMFYDDDTSIEITYASVYEEVW